MNNKLTIVIVTGLSGAGKTTALKAFEDIGFETLDNIPISLIRFLISSEQKDELSLLHMLANPELNDYKTTKSACSCLAIGIDTRTRGFGVEPVKQLIKTLADKTEIKASLLFMDCEDSTLQRRFTETRRTHPLARDRRLEDGIKLERKILGDLKESADLIVDSTDMQPGEVKKLIRDNFFDDKNEELAIFITSFSYRNGVPKNADLVFDVRFLKNPHYNIELRNFTGLDKEVGDFICGDVIYANFFKNLVNFIEPLLPRFIAEGKSYLNIALGCTGGKHRSVFVAEQLKQWFKTKNINTDIRHRELENLKIIETNLKRL